MKTKEHECMVAIDLLYLHVKSDIADDIKKRVTDALYEAKNSNSVPHVPYQLCPKCNGQGTVSKPPYVAGDVNRWTGSTGIHTCDVCGGNKIIPMFIIKS